LKQPKQVRTKRVRRSVVQFVVDALTGRLGVVMMTLAYASFGVILLAYVSTQVYTGSLMEDIARREDDARNMREEIGLLTTAYASLVSKTRIAGYCEDELGMVEASDRLLTRVIIDGSDKRSAPRVEFSRGIEIREVMGSEIGSISEVMRR
jgi:hypothetical protein